ncbi:MAG TPA: acetoacetate--CoA ligase, partial [Chryseolinea sp.]
MLWSPSKDFIEQANVSHYMKWLAREKNLTFDGYHALWKWSVENSNDFWESIWQYFDVIHDGSYRSVTDHQNEFNVSWF